MALPFKKGVYSQTEKGQHISKFHNTNQSASIPCITKAMMRILQCVLLFSERNNIFYFIIVFPFLLTNKNQRRRCLYKTGFRSHHSFSSSKVSLRSFDVFLLPSKVGLHLYCFFCILNETPHHDSHTFLRMFSVSMCRKRRFSKRPFDCKLYFCVMSRQISY